jgi:tetratricopeptide (TPR) repeat protein
MTPRNRRRPALVALLCALAASGCGTGTGGADNPTTEIRPQSGDAGEGTAGAPAALRDEIPSGRIDEVLQAHFQGLGHMERYEYVEGVKEFRRIRKLAPGWIPGAINLAIALLNDSGNKTEEAKKKGVVPPPSNYDEALVLLEGVLARDPENPHAHYCRGIILHSQGELRRAHDDFRVVTEKDPGDGHAWYKLGATLYAEDSPPPPAPVRPAGRKEAPKQIEIYERAIQCNPYLEAALYGLSRAYSLAGQKEKQEALQKLWLQMKQDREPVPGPGEVVADRYGEMGRYAQVVGPGLPRRAPAGRPTAPKFEAARPLKIALAEGSRWVKSEDLAGPLAVVGRARARFGAAVATLDADGDGRLDLFLTAAVAGPKGVRDALLINRGEGAFDDASRAFGLPEDRASLGVAVADFDADRHPDLFVTGVGDNRLFRNAGGKAFEDVTESAGLSEPSAVTLTARWLDLDQDGDLDLYVVNYTAAENAEAALSDRAVPGLANRVYRNDGKPAPADGVEASWAPLAVASAQSNAIGGLSVAFSAWPEAEALTGGDRPHAGLAMLDIDGDRDLDLVLAADGASPTAVLNDRLGRFHAVEMGLIQPDDRSSGLLVADLDKDHRTDLIAVAPRVRVAAWSNQADRSPDDPGLWFMPWPVEARGWRAAQVADVDLDGWPDLLGIPAPGEDAPRGLAWARNDGDRLGSRPLGLAGAEGPLQGFAAADLVGDPLPDLLAVPDGEAPRLARNLGNGNRWIALDLGGRWGVKPQMMRSNPQAIGTYLSLEGEGLDVPYVHTTPASGLAQSIAPVVLGLGRKPSVPLVRLRWPDGVMQAELNSPANQVVKLAEESRKTGSCPVLFTWNGERFVCLGDFLGGGGLGYLVAPGVYGDPDRDEAVAIAPDQLREAGGVYRLSVTEPMDEVAYLDRLTLDVVDRPPGVSAAPDERFAPGGNRPTGALIAWSEQVEPARATDLQGREVTDRLRAWDRRTVDGFRLLRGWTGYAEEHGIVLDFGDRLGRFGPGDSLVLGLAGWVEYPYSQTNYAAATAGVPLRPPILERQRDDGSWEVIEPDPGYPAGLPRLTMLDLTGKMTGPRCAIRLRTNMECYWDWAFVAVRRAEAGLRVTSLPVARAELGYRGYTREVSPDGRPPLLYDFDHVDPAPLVRLEGRLTRYGEVAGLLQGDDDQFCIVGPGDEVRMEFDAQSLPGLLDGWTRSYVLRSVGYCKDADPFTAASDTIGPLPWKGMPSYPFGPEGERPEDPAYREYLRTYQTRSVGGR